jgi:hypothetical protein
MLKLLISATEEHEAHFACVNHHTIQGLDSAINPDCPPKNYKDAMSSSKRQEWAASLNKESLRF